MPEMKLKQQNLLYNFKASIKSLETKLSIIEKLKSSSIKNKILDSTNKSNNNLYDSFDNAQIKSDIRKLKTDITLYETEITDLTENINRTKNLEFLVQNSSLTSKWKNEIDALTNFSQQNYNELLQQKKELRKFEMDKFESSHFTRFKLKQIAKSKENAVKLYQETISVHFYDFYSKFEKWMSDLIKLHNDLMSVQQKLVECEKSMDKPTDQIDRYLDSKINNLLDSLINLKNEYSTNLQQQQQQQQQQQLQQQMTASAILNRTPPVSPNTSTTNTVVNAGGSSTPSTLTSTSSSSNSSTKSSMDKDDTNNNMFHSVSSKASWTNFETLINR